MLATLRKSAHVLGFFLVMACVSWGQTSSLEGDVKDENGQPLKGALIKIDRTDIKGHYQVKTDKKGHYFHTGLPLGTYNLTCEVDGKERDHVNGVRSKLGDAVAINFDLQGQRKQQEALAKAAETGTLTKEQARDMTPEQKAALEKRMKDQATAMKKNKELNDAFNAGKEALEAKKYDDAIQAFQKATEIAPTEHVVWGNLADSYSGLAASKTGADQTAALDKAIQAFTKALEIKPDEAAYHNNLALALAKAKKFPEAQAALTKAAQIDPTSGGKYYYNLGAVLVNTGQMEPAGDAFRKAIELDPNYADAHYQYGIYLISKATTTPDGKIVPPPGTQESFQKYLALKPDGPYAEASKGMIASMGGKVETQYKNPSAPAPAKRGRKP